MHLLFVPAFLAKQNPSVLDLCFQKFSIPSQKDFVDSDREGFRQLDSHGFSLLIYQLHEELLVRE